MDRPFSLDGKVAFITGGNSGLGRAIALAMRDQGARVVIAGRRAQRNAKVLEDLGPEHAANELDVADEESVRRAITATIDKFGRLDILVNNAGMGQRASVMELELSAWQRVIATNLTGAFLCTKYAARQMKQQRAGIAVSCLLPATI